MDGTEMTIMKEPFLKTVNIKIIKECSEIKKHIKKSSLLKIEDIENNKDNIKNISHDCTKYNLII
jgi:hypothetical protein